jgi:hypothetical protein
MKLSATWSNKEEEARLSKADVNALRLRAGADWGERVHVLDFLKDAHFEIGRLYDEILTGEAVPAGTSRQSEEQAKHETTPNDEQTG